MQGVEIGHCDAAIRAVLTANYTLLNATVEEVLQPVNNSYGKGDTLGLDARPEIDIVQVMRSYDDNSIVITEEVGSKGNLLWTHAHDAKSLRTIYISDPHDRTAYSKKFFSLVPDKNVKVKDVIASPNAISEWESLAGSPASITGAFCAISCIRHAVPIFSVLINFITQQLFVSCSAGNYMLDIPPDHPNINLEHVKTYGTKLYFPAIRCPHNDDARRFATFVGKVGYRDNLLDSKLMSEKELDRLLYHKEPGGPSRILYLSTLQPKETPIGFILANGEKIGEWIHWLPWLSFARREDDQGLAALSLFEIYRKDQLRIKDGVLMSTPPFYSIFKKQAGNSDQMMIDITRFADFDNPSKIRSTLVVCPTGNSWVSGLVKQFGYRPIIF